MEPHSALSVTLERITSTTILKADLDSWPRRKQEWSLHSGQQASQSCVPGNEGSDDTEPATQRCQ